MNNYLCFSFLTKFIFPPAAFGSSPPRNEIFTDKESTHWFSCFFFNLVMSKILGIDPIDPSLTSIAFFNLLRSVSIPIGKITPHFTESSLGREQVISHLPNFLTSNNWEISPVWRTSNSIIINFFLLVLTSFIDFLEKILFWIAELICRGFSGRDERIPVIGSLLYGLKFFEKISTFLVPMSDALMRRSANTPVSLWN